MREVGRGLDSGLGEFQVLRRPKSSRSLVLDIGPATTAPALLKLRFILAPLQVETLKFARRLRAQYVLDSHPFPLQWAAPSLVTPNPTTCLVNAVDLGLGHPDTQTRLGRKPYPCVVSF